ncbi:MAG: hypothetical protein PHU43_04880 [Candidatus Bipolaricaulis sp.]|nr:hypothetical protein [Candidatus Bipolaricaulis sp.]
MNRVGWLLALLVVVFGLSASGDCGCPSAREPVCYTVFRQNQTIVLSVTVPVDFFLAHGTTETPLITGWRVERLDGSVVRRVTFVCPIGWPTPFEWGLDDDAGARVSEGVYRIIVETSSAGELTNYARLIPCCAPLPCGCSGSCGYPDRVAPCRPACGEAFLTLRVGETFSGCCGLGVSIFGSFTWESSPP